MQGICHEGRHARRKREAILQAQCSSRCWLPGRLCCLQHLQGVDPAHRQGRTVRDVRSDEDSFYEHKPCSVNAEQVRLLDEVIDSISIEEDQMETVVATPPVWTADEEAAVYPPPVPEETMGAAEVPRLLQDLQNMVIEPLDEESDADSYESLPVEGYETPASSFGAMTKKMIYIQIILDMSLKTHIVLPLWLADRSSHHLQISSPRPRCLEPILSIPS
jgi:hypothetical protein